MALIRFGDSHKSKFAALACVTLKRWFGFPFLEPTQLTGPRVLTHCDPLGVAKSSWSCHPLFPFKETRTPKTLCQHRIQRAETLSDLQSVKRCFSNVVHTCSNHLKNVHKPYKPPMSEWFMHCFYHLCMVMTGGCFTNLPRLTVSFRASLEVAEPGRQGMRITSVNIE